MLRLVAILLLAAPAAAGDFALGYAKTVLTRFGPVAEADFPDGKGLTFQGRRVPGVSAFFAVAILYSASRPGDRADWLLVQPSMGGNACEPGVQIVRVAPQGATASEVFGECSAPPFGMRALPGRAEVDIAEIEDDFPWRTYSFDGQGLTSVGHPEEPEWSAEVPPLESWEGRQPADFLASKQGTDVMLRFIGGDELQALRLATGTAGPIVLQQGWLMAAGCAAHDCTGQRAGLALRLADGALAAVLWQRGPGVRLLGNATSAPEVQALLAAIPPR